MTIEQLRAAHQTAPFRPFTLRMADGRSFEVPRPEYLSMSPTGRTVIVYGKDDDFAILDLLLVTVIDVEKTATPEP
jgi:hypothetical protein